MLNVLVVVLLVNNVYYVAGQRKIPLNNWSTQHKYIEINEYFPQSTQIYRKTGLLNLYIAITIGLMIVSVFASVAHIA